jgi:hypothetical protein
MNQQFVLFRALDISHQRVDEKTVADLSGLVMEPDGLVMEPHSGDVQANHR